MKLPRLRLSTIMLLVVLLSTCLALGKRIWLNEWAPFYHKRYQDACSLVVSLLQDETRYRAAGEIENVRVIHRLLESAELERRGIYWKWVKSLILNES
jgi:hypothetical protein